MTCKFCGSSLDDNEIECPYCGHKTGTAAPADPAEEMTEKFAPKEAPAVNHAQQHNKAAKAKMPSFKGAISNAVPKTAKGTGNAASKFTSQKANFSGNGIIAIGLVACLLLCLICIISVAGLKKDLETMNQDMLSLFYQIQNSTDKLQTKVDELEKSIGNVSTTINETENSRNINITKQPTSTPTYLGRGSDEDDTQNVPIFTVYAQGYNLKFNWQRYDDSTGEWINLGWDAQSNNETYGLHVYTDAEKGYSELAARDVKQEAYGTYRCQISDDYGIKNTDSVKLEQKEKE